MSWWLVALLVIAGLYAAVLLALLVAGRRTDARALAGFIPDCLVLIKRLLGDERVSRRSRLALAGVAAYLALPIDLVPDFLPVVGQLDDAIVLGLVLRAVLRSAGEALLDEHWPGPPPGREALRRIAFGRRTASIAP